PRAARRAGTRAPSTRSCGRRQGPGAPSGGSPGWRSARLASPGGRFGPASPGEGPRSLYRSGEDLVNGPSPVLIHLVTLGSLSASPLIPDWPDRTSVLALGSSH